MSHAMDAVRSTLVIFLDVYVFALIGVYPYIERQSRFWRTAIGKGDCFSLLQGF